MEEKKPVKFEKIEGFLTDGTERIMPDEIAMKKKRISPYFLLTISLAVFIIAFLFADFGFSVIKNGADDIPSHLFSSFFGGDPEEYKLTLSEYLSGRVLGLTKSRAVSIYESEIYNKADEQEKTGNEDEETNEIGSSVIIPSEIIVEPNDYTQDKESNSADTGRENGVKYPILSMDLSNTEFGPYYIGNETGYTPDIKALLGKEDIVPAFNEISEVGGPLVLIIHTHGTESYAEEGARFYIDDGGDISRSTDPEKNVIAVGKIMSEVLNANGVATIHCETMHDKESYQDSYNRAAESIKSYLAKYPSIKYVFDVHRDAILKSDGSLVKAVTDIDGEAVAQVMTVVGSNYKGANFPDWEEHLALALKLREDLNGKHESLCRPVYLRGAAYNQQYTKGSLLLEIGSSGNTLEEAKRAAELVALSLARIIKGE